MHSRASRVWYYFQNLQNPNDVLFNDYGINMYPLLSDVFATSHVFVNVEDRIRYMREHYGDAISLLNTTSAVDIYKATAHTIEDMLKE